MPRDLKPEEIPAYVQAKRRKVELLTATHELADAIRIGTPAEVDAAMLRLRNLHP